MLTSFRLLFQHLLVMSTSFDIMYMCVKNVHKCSTLFPTLSYNMHKFSTPLHMYKVCAQVCDLFSDTFLWCAQIFDTMYTCVKNVHKCSTLFSTLLYDMHNFPTLSCNMHKFPTLFSTLAYHMHKFLRTCCNMHKFPTLFSTLACYMHRFLKVCCNVHKFSTLFSTLACNMHKFKKDVVIYTSFRHSFRHLLVICTNFRHFLGHSSKVSKKKCRKSPHL